MFHYTVETTKTPELAIEALTENLKAEKFGVLWQLDMKEKLQEKGAEFDMPYQILEVCNPVEARPSVSCPKMHWSAISCRASSPYT